MQYFRKILVYNALMNIKRKKGFTLIEAVITIGVLSIVVAMTAVVISNMVRIQSASSTQYEANEEISKANKLAEEYVSFVSVNNSALSFDYSSHTNTSVTFSCGVDTFSLKFLNQTLSYSCDTTYSGDNEYLKQSNSIELKNVDAITFDYANDIKMLSMDITVLGRHSSSVFYLRTLG